MPLSREGYVSRGNTLMCVGVGFLRAMPLLDGQKWSSPVFSPNWDAPPATDRRELADAPHTYNDVEYHSTRCVTHVPRTQPIYTPAPPPAIPVHPAPHSDPSRTAYSVISQRTCILLPNSHAVPSSCRPGHHRPQDALPSHFRSSLKPRHWQAHRRSGHLYNGIGDNVNNDVRIPLIAVTTVSNDLP